GGQGVGDRGPGLREAEPVGAVAADPHIAREDDDQAARDGVAVHGGDGRQAESVEPAEQPVDCHDHRPLLLGAVGGDHLQVEPGRKELAVAGQHDGTRLHVGLEACQRLRERLLLVLRWAAVAGLAGVVPGMAAGLIAASVARRFLRWAVVGVLVGATVVPVLLAGRRPPPPGTPAVYAPAPEGRAPRDAPNLVLVTIDTLRHDHLELYGYDRQTAPHLAALGGGGTVFEAAVAQAPETVHSLASLMTGLYPHAFDAQ